MQSVLVFLQVFELVAEIVLFVSESAWFACQVVVFVPDAILFVLTSRGGRPGAEANQRPRAATHF